jgi:hypothetical protein
VSADLDVQVPYWPALYPQVRPEAAAAVQFWPTPAAEALLADPEPEPEAGL